MSARIFEDIPEAVDETWTHVGAMLGGMTGPLDLGDSYFLAGEALIESVLSRQNHGYELIYPIMYTYRHGVELYLKAIVSPAPRHHDLAALLGAFRAHIESRYGEKVPAWLANPISELATYDPASDVFRYEQTRHQRLQNEGEFWVDLRALRDRMDRVRVAFRRVMSAEITGQIPPQDIGQRRWS
jgi:hypothetical protein